MYTMPPIKIHPAVLILAWMGFALALAGFQLFALIAASGLVAVVILASGVSRCWRLIRRTRILLSVLLLVYLFTTPGTALFTGWDQAGPTQEGLIAGAFQAWRLLLMISALAALLAFLSRQNLLAGIYVLLLPLKPLGVPVERFSMRLWLTLHYAEAASKAESLNARWESAMILPEKLESDMTLEVPNFGLQDVIFIGIYGVLLSMLWLG